MFKFVPLSQNPEFGTSESFSEAQQNIENLHEDIRQLEVHVTKAEARLETLRGAGLDVSKWLQKAGGDNQDRLSSSDLQSKLGEGKGCPYFPKTIQCNKACYFWTFSLLVIVIHSVHHCNGMSL